MKRLALTLAFILTVAKMSPASTGCSYPTSHDSWSDKIAGDFLTIADVNQFRCAIEKLESGPVRPTGGSTGTPAFSFRDDPDTGMWNPGPNAIAFSTGGSERLRINAAGALLLGNAAVTGVGGEDIVLDNARFIRWVNNVQTTAATLFISGTNNDQLIFGTNGVTQVTINDDGAMRLGNAAITGVTGNSLVLKNNSPVSWLNAAGTSVGNFGIYGNNADSMVFSVPGAGVYAFTFAGVSLGRIGTEHDAMKIHFDSKVSANPTSPPAQTAILFHRDNGSGKGQLCATFPTGGPQCFATEP
jgi:hypothetical protein